MADKVGMLLMQSPIHMEEPKFYRFGKNWAKINIMVTIHLNLYHTQIPRRVFKIHLVFILDLNLHSHFGKIYLNIRVMEKMLLGLATMIHLDQEQIPIPK